MGPTPDDLTTETIADFFDVPLIERSEILEDMAQKFALRGRTLTPSNRKQALLPTGADILPNPVGSAPGLIWQPRPGLTLLTFPGVPTEMQRMWQETAVPFLQRQGWGQRTIYSRTLKYWGIAESALAEQIPTLLALENPTVAPYANYGEVKLRISARAASDAAAQVLIAPIEQQLRAVGGLDCYGADDETLATVVGKQLQTREMTLAVAESCTGGGLGHLLTEVPGSSQYFLGGVIAYENSVKETLLGVDAGVLAQVGAVSREVAQQMAVGVRSRLGATWGLSITGIAGPDGGTPEKPVGLVYIGLAGPGASVTSFEHRFGSQRSRPVIRRVSACSALDHLRRQLLQK
ncbi:competence/damage-inducible protein A [Neosynechococcus sphagnicola]|uniref:competence/damage-inducible protein A n=1 Tax=Neosynechococcus sphagnicola TaxID=1501145 RepID=UPI000A8E9E84